MIAQKPWTPTTTLAEDLREMNEEQFICMFNYLRERTRDFKEFSPDLILENNQYLLVLRLCLGLSQRKFAKALGRTKDWARHIESSRRKIIHLKPANRYLNKINLLLNRKHITLERGLKNWRRYKFARDQDFPEIEVRMKPFLEMKENDFKIRPKEA